MKVQELIEILSELDPERVVVMAADPEGNAFDTLHGVEIGRYACGEFGYETLTEDLRVHGYTEEDLITDGEPCVALWP